MLVGWLVRTSLTALGGMRAYKRIRAAAVGMVLGDFLVAALWVLIDALAGVVGHSIFPGPDRRNV